MQQTSSATRLSHSGVSYERISMAINGSSGTNMVAEVITYTLSG